MARQLTFDLTVRTALGRDDFFVSPANAVALSQIEDVQSWPEGKLALVGPPGSGKTHLVTVWAERAGAVVLKAGDLAATEPGPLANAAVAVEDVEDIAGDPEAEAVLFHLHNLIRSGAGRLLLTATQPPARWNLGLPDLASRMEATPVAKLEPPDDALLFAVLVKLFADRQLAVGPDVIGFLVLRMPRSLAAAGRIVEAIDEAALTERRRITRHMASRVLDRLAERSGGLA